MPDLSDEQLAALITATANNAVNVHQIIPDVHTVLALVEEVRAARAVLARLPRTADGVPVVFGMEVWFFDEEADYPSDGTWEYRGDLVKTTVKSVYTKNFEEYIGGVTVGVDADWEGGNEEVYSTREAGIAALAAQPLTGETPHE